MRLLGKLRNYLQSFGVWTGKVKYLPIGTDLKVDLEQRYGLVDPKLIFDVGANIGQSHRMFRNSFPKSKIICFEPIKSSFQLLGENTQNDPSTKLEPLALGAYPHNTEIRLFEEWSVLNSLKPDQMNQNPSAKTQTVEVTTLDKYCEDNGIGHIDLLKIDTEGYETEVLEGAKQKLRSGSIGCIFCETGFYESNTRNTGLSKLLKFLEEYDYLLAGFYQFNNELAANKMMYANVLFIRKAFFPKK